VHPPDWLGDPIFLASPLFPLLSSLTSITSTHLVHAPVSRQNELRPIQVRENQNAPAGKKKHLVYRIPKLQPMNSPADPRLGGSLFFSQESSATSCNQPRHRGGPGRDRGPAAPTSGPRFCYPPKGAGYLIRSLRTRSFFSLEPSHGCSRFCERGYDRSKLIPFRYGTIRRLDRRMPD
jgi:hypothetical protein